MADYGQDLAGAVFHFPLAAAFALLPPRSERMGHKQASATRGDRAWLAKKAEVKAWLREHYHIVKSLPHG